MADNFKYDVFLSHSPKDKAGYEVKRQITADYPIYSSVGWLELIP
jgi:hypothetical protein